MTINYLSSGQYGALTGIMSSKIFLATEASGTVLFNANACSILLYECST